MHKGAKVQSLASMSESDFPFAIRPGDEAKRGSLARLNRMAQQLAAPKTTKISSLAGSTGDVTEIKATDSPIGLAEAAKILADKDLLEKVRCDEHVACCCFFLRSKSRLMEGPPKNGLISYTYYTRTCSRAFCSNTDTQHP
jgi:hypothetical protein